ncbi:Zn-ribbon domain-containing OB-fold protein [Frankia sp. AiPs1]|uniref:Zn-ribbon domain-containing OB-fold protein n=1 Tax=Frankia sp. AiPs1 TaxID=573493 RepID=UPI0020433231|nr:Zn-ribbon domain-containing OB-fold protein [Frankia sp. AiPs1]MCM3922231.1 Zn-ribbon domain-containing OB-fold protein [Frankia sp. AiPs1]
MTTLTTTLPPAGIQITTDAATEPFWQAAKENRLVAPRCADCGTFRLPPSPFCPTCQSQNVDWVTLSGRATVFSFSIVNGVPGQPELTLAAVVVDLPDAPGARLVSNVVDTDPAAVRIGTPLTVDFVEIAEGWKLPVFRIDSAAESAPLAGT